MEVSKVGHNVVQTAHLCSRCVRLEQRFEGRRKLARCLCRARVFQADGSKEKGEQLGSMVVRSGEGRTCIVGVNRRLSWGRVRWVF